LGYIASAALNAGHEVSIYNQDIHHYPDSHLTEYLDKNKFDVVGLGIIAGYYQFKKLKAISKAINQSKNRPFYVLGGHGPSPEPKFFIDRTQADAIVIGEGDITFAKLLDTIENKQSLSDVNGIAYKSGDEVIVNERRTLIQDIDSIPFPAYHLFPMEYYRLLRLPNCRRSDFVISMVSGRGCPFKCNFCYRMDKGHRARSSENIIEEIKFLQKDYAITHVHFADELLMSSINRTINICESFLKAKLNIRWGCNGRLNYARRDVIKLMKESGCVFINYGIESMDDTVLKNMNKSLNTKQIIEGIENTLAEGISSGFNIIFGNFGDNKDVMKKNIDFLLKYDDCAQMHNIRPVTPYPGSELYYKAIEMGLLEDCADFYDNKHQNSDLLAVNFTELDDNEFYETLLDANKMLMTNYYNKKLNESLDMAENLYRTENVKFRGFRPV